MTGAPPFLEVAPFSFAAALLLTPLVRSLARATGYLDHPDERKPHPHPTPLLGGVAVFGAMVIGPLLSAALLRASPPISAPALGVVLGASLSLLLGLVDDKRPMRPLGKLMGQLGAALCLVTWGGASGFMANQPLLAAIAVVGVVALLNAVNFLDAMDGIVSAVAPITGLGFVALALVHGARIDLPLAWATVGAAAGFLVYNAPPARIFLGDAGSHLIGFVLAALTLQAIDSSFTPPHVAAVVALVAYPLFDVIFVVTTRLIGGRAIHIGGVDHSTHRLSRICGRWGTLGVIAGATLVGAGVGVWLWGVKSDTLAATVVASLGLGYAIFGLWLGRSRLTRGFDT
ncbi:MAG TPA: MraY family glycosyltransferase [Candidatus Eisenbacteria bacterium]|nr:MraY family glycosyltransferase [Candidatus Eisenbacteria bacterium]